MKSTNRTPIAIALTVAALACATFVPAARAGELIGVFAANRGEIALHDDDGTCLRGAKRATWSDEAGAVPGCWVAIDHEGKVLIRLAFLDGDALLLPVEMFRNPGGPHPISRGVGGTRS